MPKYDKRFTLIETDTQLMGFHKTNRQAPWLAFDTEFIPEKYYRYRLCVISVATAKGNYVLDVLKLKSIGLFLEMINDPAILKITHAGENDYQILIGSYNAKPAHVFDTQLSYAFLQYDYPVGLQQLLHRELNVRLDKGQLKSDWEKRPLTPEQCQYAVEDVVYLHPLMEALERRLKRRKKWRWAVEENRRLEDLDYYRTDPLEFLNGAQISQLTMVQQVFLMRMHLWRHLEAEKEDRPVTQILKTRVLNTIVQKAHLGKAALMKDRTLPGRFLNDNWDTFEQLYKEKIADHEKELLAQIQDTGGASIRGGILTDILYQLIRYKGHQHKVSPKVIISGKELNRVRGDEMGARATFLSGWRRELLGDDMIRLLEHRGDYDLRIKNNKITITLESNQTLSFFRRIFTRGGDKFSRDIPAESEKSADSGD